MLPSSSRIVPLTTCAALLVTLAFPPTTRSQSLKHTTSYAKTHSKYGLDITTPMPPMPLVAPLFLQTDQIDSNITVVNVATADVQGQITLRDNQGGIVGQQLMVFTKNSSTVFPMKTLLAQAGSQAHSGSVTLLQDEHIPGVALVAQLSMTLHAGSQSSFLEEEFGMPNPHGSATLHGVASQSRNLPLVAVTSTIDAPQTITANCLGQSTPTTFQVPPLGTAVVQACSWHPLADASLNLTSNLLSNLDSLESDHAITLQSDSVPGAFYAFGFAVSADLAHPELQPLDFYDPSDQHSTGIVYTGIPIGSTSLLPSLIGSPVVTLANFSAQPRAVQIDLANTSAGTSKMTPLSQVTVPARSTTSVKLAAPQTDSLLNTVSITSDGSPGDIHAHLFSPVGGTHQRYEMLAKDMQDPHNGGSHPWSIAGGTRSTLLLYNTSDEPNQFEVRILDPANTWIELYQLAPHETKAISINDLVTKSTPDHKGKLLHPDIQSGEVQWSTEFGATGRGRLLETNASQSLARSFSCYNYFNLCDASFGSGNYQNITLGNQLDFYTVGAYMCSVTSSNVCNSGYTSSPTYSFNTTWTNYSPDIVSMPSSSSSDAYFQGQAPGNFSISAMAEYGSCQSAPMSGGGSVGGVPYSMKVYSDQGNQQDNVCSVTSQNGVLRKIIYEAFDSSNNPASSYLLEEAVPAPISSCNQQQVALTSSCSYVMNSNSLFLDKLGTAYCSPTPSNSCGFSLTPDHWDVCNVSKTPIGNPTYVIQWNNVTINGSTYLNPGTPIP